MTKKATSAGLDRRHRDRNGEIRQKRGDTLVSTLRKTYGDEFARGVRGDTTLGDLLKRQGYGSLKETFVVRPGIDLTKPIYDQAVGRTKKDRRH